MGSSLIQPSTWHSLQAGQRVTFTVVNVGKHPHALELEPASGLSGDDAGVIGTRV